jgi:hypothetical protein
MLNHLFFLRNLTIAACFLGVFSSLCKASIEISPVDFGNYRNNGNHSAVSLNYVAQMNASANYRNFFIFDLSSVTETILSATLKLENPQLTDNTVTSTYTLYDVSTSVTILTSNQTGATAIYADLGTGTTYGSVALASSIAAGLVEIPLNPDAIAAMNATSGMFALGGAISTATSSMVRIFTFTTDPLFTQKLVLELEEPVLTPPSSTDIVPEPASMFVWCGVGLMVCLGAAARRKV